MNAATKPAKPFASLSAALNALDAPDMVSDLDIIAADATGNDATLIAEAIDSIKCAETVECMYDFGANLQMAASQLASVKDAAQVSAKIARLLARC